MKLMMAILNDRNAEGIITRLVENEFRVTRIASTGGFLRQGNTTLLIGMEETLVKDALKIMREESEEQSDAGQWRATVFVLDVAKFTQL